MLKERKTYNKVLFLNKTKLIYWKMNLIFDYCDKFVNLKEKEYD